MNRKIVAAALVASTACCWTAQAADTNFGKTVISETEDEGYVIRHSMTGTKTDTPVIETPMSVQSISSQLIDDQAAASSLEALMNVSGVQSQQGTFYDQFQIRGFGSGYGVTYRDGLQLEGIAEAVNMAFAEKIEVVKGPVSMLYGRVEPGGFVNVVTKKPQGEFTARVQQRVGSWDEWHTTADVTGAIDQQKVWSFRVIGDYDKGDYFFDYGHYNKKAALGALAFAPSDRFDANLTLEYYDYLTSGRGPNTAVPVVGDRPDSSVSRSASGSSAAIWTDFPDSVKRTLISLDWTYRINGSWNITQRAHYVDVDEVQTGLGDWGGTYGFIYNPLSRSIYNVNLDLSGEFLTGAIRHDVLIGVDAYKYSDYWKGFVGDTSIPVVDLGHDDITAQLYVFKDESLDNTLWRTLEAGTGLYFQDRMQITEQWQALFGGRFDRAHQHYTETYGSISSACYPDCSGEPMGSWPRDNRFSPRAAVLYKLTPDASLYVSYSKSFGTNNSSYLASGSFAAPEIGEQYELGTKANLLEGRALVTATVYQLTKSNVLGTNPADPYGQQIPIGQIRSRGLELDFIGQINRLLDVQASYTWNPVTIRRDTTSPENEGHRYTGAPLNAASTWLKFDTARGESTAWICGVGVYYDGLRQGDNANTWQMPGYTRVDAMVGYRRALHAASLDMQLNVKNVTDKHYFDQIGWGVASYGAPRSVMATIALKY